MADRSVRPALPGDATTIAEVQAAAVHADHPDLPAGLADALRSDAAVAAWRAAATAPPSPAHRLLVALEDQQVVGYAVLAPSPDADAAGADVIELHELRVHPRSTRQGHGSRLLAAAVNTLRPASVSELVCWAGTGTPLEGLLAQTGWGADGSSRELAAAGALLPQTRWRTRLDELGSSTVS